MRVTLTSGAFVEGAVTVAVALLMTFAGFEMVQTTQASGAPGTVSSTQSGVGVSVLGTATATAGRCVVDLPHVDELHG